REKMQLQQHKIPKSLIESSFWVLFEEFPGTILSLYCQSVAKVTCSKLCCVAISKYREPVACRRTGDRLHLSPLLIAGQYPPM
ncbi:MAG: hypothetical protein AAFY11_15955, partial [Cyanobacteria bacterium J06641_5]